MSRVGTITVVDGYDRVARFERAVSGHPINPEHGQAFGPDRVPGAVQAALMATPIWVGVVDPTHAEVMTLWEATQYGVAVLVSVENSAVFEETLTVAVDEARRFAPATVQGFEVPAITDLGADDVRAICA